MNFKQWLLTEMFSHPGRLGNLTTQETLQFALAVYKIMHNAADYPEWELMDKYVTQNGLHEVVNVWIGQILKMNGVDDDQIIRELDWFKKELAKGSN